MYRTQAVRFFIFFPLTAGLLLCCISPSAFAVDIPFHQILLGTSSPSILDDKAAYPASYISLETTYWDIYHERRAGSLHDYDQSDTRVKAILRRDSFLFGVELGRSLLSLEQENIYTEADRLDGKRDLYGGKIYLGLAPGGSVYPLGLNWFEVVGSAGWVEGFTGDLEGLLEWPVAAFQLRVQTLGNRLELEEEMNGFRFPFFFPFRTDRFFGRTELSLPRNVRFRAWGGIGTSHGEGEAVKGFENRLWNRCYTFGGSVDYRLQPELRFHCVPRLEVGQSPPGLRLSIQHQRGNGDLGMYFNGTRYLHLEDLNSYNTVVRLDLVPIRSVSIFGGWERIRIEHGGDSFFDMWPFTVWDAFQANRYRLDQMDVHLDMWFAGAGGKIQRGRLELESSGRFEWWKDAGTFDWLERYDVVFPFFFRYERHTVTTNVSQKYAVQADLVFNVHATSRVSLRISGRVMVPFGREGEEPGGGTPGTGGGAPVAVENERDTTHGGLIGTVEIISRL